MAIYEAIGVIVVLGLLFLGAKRVVDFVRLKNQKD